MVLIFNAIIVAAIMAIIYIIYYEDIEHNS